jgi:hypothetical protein
MQKKFRIRIAGFETKAARAFRFHPLNFRRHGAEQRAALRTMLGDVGWVQGVIENRRTGNLIDGHARIEEALRDDPEQSVPYVLVDLTRREEKAVLATLDQIGAMAETDPTALAALYQETIAGMPRLGELLQALHGDEIGASSAGEASAAPTRDQAIPVPPYSVFDTRQGYWQLRKRQWIDQGIRSELGRGEALSITAPFVYVR